MSKAQHFEGTRRAVNLICRECEALDELRVLLQGLLNERDPAAHSPQEDYDYDL